MASRLIVAVIGVGLWMPDTLAGARDDGLLRRIQADWAHRRKVFSRVKYIAEGEILFARGCYNDLPEEDRSAGGGDIPTEDQTFPAHLALFLDLDRGKARKEWSDYSLFAPEGKIKRLELVNVFDGAVMRQRDLDRARGIDLLMPTPSHFQYFFFDYNDYAMLCAHGIVPRIGNMPVEWLRAPASTGEYVVHGNAISNGRPVVVLRTPPAKDSAGTFAEAWVDVERQSAVVRWATYDNGTVFARLDVAYGEGERGWWPSSWELTSFQFGKTVVDSAYRFRVSQFDADPPMGADLFNENPKPGMIVRDATTGVYRYQGPGRPPEPLGGPSQTGTGIVHGAVWSICAGVAALVFVIAVCIWLRARTAKGDGRH